MTLRLHLKRDESNPRVRRGLAMACIVNCTKTASNPIFFNLHQIQVSWYFECYSEEEVEK